jgi:hypothetical protein
MKHSIFLLLLTASLFTACKKSDIEYANDFDRSYEAWTNFKTTSGNSYRYTTVSGSWTGTGTETIITIESGKVTQRSYVYTVPDRANNTFVIQEQWTETGNNLNTHTNGAATITLEEIYQKARNEWLKKRADATIYFETKNNGMISSCGYVDDNCADDCFRGITLQKIEKL